MHEPSRYEFFVMLAVGLLSFFGAPIYVVGLGAVLLTLSTAQEHAHLQLLLIRAGSARLMAGAFVSIVTASLAFSALCSAIGKGFAWLIA